MFEVGFLLFHDVALDLDSLVWFCFLFWSEALALAQAQFCCLWIKFGWMKTKR